MPSSRSANRKARSGSSFIIKKIASALGTPNVAVFEFRAPDPIDPDHPKGWRHGWAGFLGFKIDELPAHRALIDWVAKRIDPADLSALQDTWHGFVKGREEDFDARFRIRHKDGRWMWARGFGQATARDGDGRLTRGLGAVIDVSDQAEGDIRRQRLLATTEPETDAARQRYAAILESLSCIVFEAKISGMRFTYVNSFAEDLLGHALPRWYEPGFFLDVVVDPADRAEVLQALDGDRATKSRVEVEFRAVTAHGERRWLKGLARLDCDDGRSDDRTDSHSRADRLIRGMFLDMTESRTLQETEQRLMGEVDHRGKNLLAAVQSMATLAYTSRTSSEEFVGALIRRIRALTRAHDQLAASRWEGVSLRELIASEVRAFNRSAKSRIMVEGDDLILKPRAVQTLSLVLHELAANAGKYGALSVPTGSVRIAWSIDSERNAQMVHFLWEESDGPEVAHQGRMGFGTLVMERAVAHDLNAHGRLEFAPGGVRYGLTVAWDELVEDNKNERGEGHHGAGKDSDRRG